MVVSVPITRAGLARDVRNVPEVIEVAVVNEDEVGFGNQRVDQGRVGPGEIRPRKIGPVVIRVPPSTVFQARWPRINEYDDIAIGNLPSRRPEVGHLQGRTCSIVNLCLDHRR